jgi:hypothetical protein
VSGPARVLAVAYAILALAASARSLIQIASRWHEAPVAYGLSAAAAGVYLVIAVAIRRRGRRTRRILLAACCAELAWVLTVGASTLGRTDAFGDQTVWSRFGEGYGYLPLALPLLTLAWLTHGRPELPPRRVPDRAR